MVYRLNTIENVINYTKTLIETASHTRHIHSVITLSGRGEYKDTGIILPDKEKESILKDIDLSIREVSTILYIYTLYLYNIYTIFVLYIYYILY